MMLGVDTVVTQHFKMFFRDMDNKPFDEIEGRDALFDGLIIFVPGVMERDIFHVVFINTGSGDNRTSQIPADVFNGDIRSTKVRFSPDIKTGCMIFIDIIFDFSEGSPDG